MSEIQLHGDLFSDASLQRRLRGFLASQGLCNWKMFEISIVGGVVYLSGQLDSATMLEQLEHACRRVAGVIDVDSTAVRIDVPHASRHIQRRKATRQYFLSRPPHRAGEAHRVVRCAFSPFESIARQ
jgi:hypothetical protein